MARKSGLPLKRFFNTSGLRYKALGLKDKLPAMTEDEAVCVARDRRHAGQAPADHRRGLCSSGF